MLLSSDAFVPYAAPDAAVATTIGGGGWTAPDGDAVRHGSGGDSSDAGYRCLSDEQIANIEKLMSDLQQIAAKSEVTQEQIQQFRTDLRTLVEGTVPPSPETVEAFASTVTTALEDGKVTALELLAIQSSFADVLESMNVPPEELQAVISDLAGIVAASHVTLDDVKLIVGDIVAILQQIPIDAANCHDGSSTAMHAPTDLTQQYDTDRLNLPDDVFDIRPYKPRFDVHDTLLSDEPLARLSSARAAAETSARVRR